MGKRKILDLPAHGACTMVRKRILKSIGGYSTEFKAQDGHEIWLNICNRYKVSNINTPLFYYRRHNQSITQDNILLLDARKRIKRNIVKNKNFKRYLYNRNGSISLALGDMGAVIVDMKKGEVNEGTCGYGEDGKLGEEPAGPHLLKKKKNEIATRNRKHLNKFSKSQLDTLRKQYGTVKGVNPSSPTYKKLVYMLDSLPLANLKQLEKAKIPFISGLARNRVYRAKKFGSTTGG